MRKTSFFLLFLLFFANCQGSDQTQTWKGEEKGGFEAKITLSSHEINIDDPLTIDLTLTYPDTHTPVIQALVPQLLLYDGFGPAPFALDSQTTSPEEPVEGAPHLLSQKVHIRLFPQLPGSHPLTFYAIPFAKKGDGKSEIEVIISNIFTVEVRIPDVKPNISNLIAPPLPLSQRAPISISIENKRAYIDNKDLAKLEAKRIETALENKKIPWQIIPAGLTLAILLLIIKSPIKAASATKHSPTKEELQKRALKHLETLKKSFSETGNGDVYFRELDKIVRSQIESAYQINAPALTTPEFLKTSAKAKEIDPATRSLIASFLMETDRVKFARHRPSVKEQEKITLAAARLVMVSPPPPVMGSQPPPSESVK